jgi:hypothetical protein
MAIKHLESDHINDIALQLGEDVYGAYGDLDEFEIHEHLMQAIVEHCNFHIATTAV